jgi:hypothetical protein
MTVWARILISAQNIYKSRSVGISTAGYRLNTSGIAEDQSASGYSTLESWILFGTTSNYECRATLNSGTSPTGSAVGSWLALSSSREWYVTKASVGSTVCSLLIEIRNATTLVTLTSAVIDLEAERT